MISKKSVLLLISIALWLSAMSLAAEDLPIEYKAELQKITDPVERARLERAVAIWMGFLPASSRNVDAAIQVIMNSPHEDLVLFLFTKGAIRFGLRSPSGNKQANENLRLLTRAMLHVAENFAGNIMNPTEDPDYGRLDGVSQEIVWLMRAKGVAIDDRSRDWVWGKWSPARAFDWLEAELGGALRVTSPGSQFYKTVEECLKLVRARREVTKKTDSRAQTTERGRGDR